jgi:putative membrane-bound dehydrogenase-like protein
MILAPTLRRLITPALIAVPLLLASHAAALDSTFQINDFAGPPEANYPTAISAAPNGDVYVSSDRNGSLGHAKKMGKIVLCRDTDNDGKADKFVDFIPDLDSPRGGHLAGGVFYVIHPPYLSSFVDKDGDGVADERKQLVDGLGGGIEHPRGADHTTNAVRMGIDGWLYIAVGDFGMFGSKGTDGTRVELFGGGIARVRPDGTELETFAIMTRNNCDMAIAPTLDLFTRDNTNDGKGWNVRFHHFTHLGDHGYPRLYQHFKDEAIAPLADFGGGSGTGAFWLDEPGFPAKFSNTLFTCDWTTGNIYHNPVQREFASYTVKQDVFLKLPRAIDMDVDGFSRLYVADWRDGGFDHAKDGKPVGRIQRIVCPGEKPAQYVDVTKVKDAELPALLASASGVQRLEASRALITRGRKLAGEVLALAKDAKQSEAVRVAAVFTYKQMLGKDSTKELVALAGDATVKEYALRALADRKTELAGVPAKLFVDGLKDANPRVVLQAIIGLERLGDKKAAADILVASTGWKDGGASPRLLHTARTTLVHLANTDALFDAVKDPATRALALGALQRLHQPAVVKGLIAQADSAKDADLRFAVLGALARLTYQEKPWDLKYWWQTRPDDRGPYHETVAWSETPTVIAALEKHFPNIAQDRQSQYLDLLAKNRIAVTDLKLPGIDPVTLALGLGKLDEASSRLLVQAAQDGKRPFAQRVLAFKAQSRAEGIIGLKGKMEILAGWAQEKDIPAEAAQHQNDFITETERGTQVKDLHKLAREGSDGVSRIAWSAMLNVLTSPLAKDGWKNDVKKIVQGNPKEVGFFLAITERKLTGFDPQIDAALKSDNRKLVEAATAAKAIATGGAADASVSGKRVAELTVKDVAAAAMTGKGDVETGKRLFTQQGCIACHAIDLKAEQKGPYLGAAGAKFTRDYLIDSVLDPNKVVAQGFQTFLLAMKDGSQHMGFITSEVDGVIELRNIAGQMSKLKRAEVEKESHLPQSMMPPGLAGALTVGEFTSLVEYLVSLKAQGG